jgi:hypothetical protein
MTVRMRCGGPNLLFLLNTTENRENVAIVVAMAKFRLIKNKI